jgi:hypothetical protein
MDIDSDSIRLIGEADLLELAGIARSTWNGWVKSGYVTPPSTGLYDECDVVGAIVLRHLGDCLPMSKAAIAWRDCEIDLIACCTGGVEQKTTLDLVVDLHTLAARPTEGPDQLLEALHAPLPSPRPRVVIVLAEILQEARAGFWRRARPASDFSDDKRRKPAARRAPDASSQLRSISPALRLAPPRRSD